MKKKPESLNVSTPQEDIEALEGVLNELETAWAGVNTSLSGTRREKTLRAIEERRAEILTRLAKLKDVYAYPGATNISQIYEQGTEDKTAYERRQIEEVIKFLQEKLTRAHENPKKTSATDIRRIEVDLKKYRHMLTVLKPPEDPHA